jgi:16S rRNA C1402 N4-methylase RsmH
MIIILITPFGRQPKGLKDLSCRFPQSGYQMESGSETMNKKLNDLLNTWNIFQPHGSQKEKEMITKEIVQENEEIKLATTTEVKNELENNINPKKALGFDLITREVLQQLLRKAVVKITNLINAAFRLKYVPRL